MIRANLIPPESRGAQLFGIRFDASDVWRFGIAFLAAFVPAILIWLLYGLAIASSQRHLASLDAQLSQMASETNDVGQLASDVKRLKEINTDSAWLKRSGEAVALRLAYLGNAVPTGTWLDDIAQDHNGWRLDGTGASLDSMSRLLSGVAAASPGLRSTFENISASTSRRDYSFKATITTPTPTPAPLQGNQRG